MVVVHHLPRKKKESNSGLDAEQPMPTKVAHVIEGSEFVTSYQNNIENMTFQGLSAFIHIL